MTATQPRGRIVLFVPLGLHPQTADVFNMGGDHWQTHRSTWEPADLEALGFDVAVWDGYHHQPGKDSRAAFCVWEPGLIQRASESRIRLADRARQG
jgi:hypothetical protein